MIATQATARIQLTEIVIPALLRSFVGALLDFAGRKGALLTFGLMLAGALLEGLGLALLVPLVGVLTGGGHAAHSVFAWAGITTPMGRLAALLAIFVIVIAIRGVVLMARDDRLNRLRLGFAESERLRVMRAVATADWDQVSGLRHARVTAALTSEIMQLSGATQLMMQIAVSVVMLTVQLAVVAVLTPGVGAAAIGLLLLGAATLPKRLRRAEAEGLIGSRAQVAFVDVAGQLLAGLKTSLVENRQDAFLKTFAATSTALAARMVTYQRRLTRFRVAASTGTALAGAVILLLGLWMQGAGPALLASLLIVSRTAAPAIAAQQNVERLATQLPAYAELRRLTGELEHAGAAPLPERDAVLKGALSFDRVTYVHAGLAGVHDVSFTIQPGEFVGIVGPSGAGKTTAIDLISGLLRPQSGEVRIGDQRLDRDVVRAWRERIAYVGQEAFLIHDSIRANLSWGQEELDETRLWQTLEQVRIADSIRAMPQGLDTMVAERGARLSGGERQRIALARALVRSPDLLILDEATNAIDIATERQIIDTIATLAPRPTVIVVAHRSETLRACTRLLTIEDGRLVQDEKLG